MSYGPTGRELAGFIALVLVVGGLLGVGCAKVVGYVWPRIHVEWRP